ncbi:MAG: acyl-CoA thioester hydrolase/BAAT C-terminal domain-containing protein [Bdellovibrionota bacterium]
MSNPLKTKEKTPTLLVFGGFERAARVLELVKPSIPIIAASFDYPFSPPRRFEFPQSFRHAPEAKRAVQDTLKGIRLLKSYLHQRPDVNKTQTLILGASFGAPFALAAAAEDPDITGVILIHGFAQIPETLEQRLAQRLQPRFGLLGEVLAKLVTSIGWWYLEAPSPEESIANLKSHQRVLMVSAEKDNLLPKTSVDALWHSLEHSQAQVERVQTNGDHIQAGASSLIKEVSGLVTQWMKTHRLAP